MIGMDRGETITRGHVVQGDADISVKLLPGTGSQDYYLDRGVDVLFSSIRDLNNGDYLPNIAGTFTMIPSSNRFGSVYGNRTHITGSFAGPNNENVLGTFETNDLVGAFGGLKVE